jgi:hypothetical protein
VLVQQAVFAGICITIIDTIIQTNYTNDAYILPARTEDVLVQQAEAQGRVVGPQVRTLPYRCVCICIYVYICVYVCVYMYIYVYMYVYICIYVYIYVYMYRRC